MNPPEAPASATDRLFLALWPDARLRGALARHAGNWHWPRGARRVRAEKLHLTLHFLGEVARERTPALIAELAVPCAPFELVPGPPATWAHGLAVLEVAHPPAALTDLHSALGKALHHAGLSVERRAFRPHITLARQATGALPPAQEPELVWTVRAYVLAASTLGAGGGYRVLARYPARGAGA